MQEGTLRAAMSATLATGFVFTLPAAAQQPVGNYAGDLLVSSSTYTDPGFAVGAALPNSNGATAVASSAFCTTANCSGNVWNNVAPDGNFGITSNLYLSDVNTTSGAVDNTVNVTAVAAAQGIYLNTSFSSKSEGGINLTPNGAGITFMDYNATAGQLDLSNSNTPSVTEPGNTDTAPATYRGVVQFSLSNNGLQYTTTNAYNGNNGRAAVLGSNGYYYMVGNAGNGNGSTQTTAGTGVQLLTPGVNATPTSTTTQVGAYSIAQNGYTADKTAKDNNFRGETIFNGTLYVTKGSGSNGINTVYQVGPAGMTASTTSPTDTASGGIAVLPGFSTTLAKATPTAAAPVDHPFGLFFANSSTLYVADEGSGTTSDFLSAASGGTPYEAGGIQKYTLGSNGLWTLDYTLRGSLIGASYTVNGTGSLGNDSLTTTTDGLRNLAGKVNADGTVTLYAVTSTAGSLLGDAGADPNKLVEITDTIGNTSGPGVGEDYTTLETAGLGQVLRGVAVAPVPLPASAWLLLTGLGGFGFARRRRGTA